MPGMQQTIKEIQDTLTVVAGIQARQAELIKGHGEWLQEHDRELAEDRKRAREIDERIDKLVSAIGELIRKP